ncbi:P-loop containing nucleoside triphosphate hydrolase [Phytophthora cactorum]|nr:P-loop containing nucleoside triphosphate hydrolase [Phytophthora cactorum]
MAGDKSSKKKVSKTKAYVSEWPSTNPSSSSRSIPTKTNEKLQKLVSPHLDSFNFFLTEGLDLAVADMCKVPVELPNQHRMDIWIENAQIGYPTTENQITGEQKLLPKRERLQRVVGEIPIMVRSKRCHLSGMAPTDLVKAREEANEMGGYFICNGNERCVRLLQMPRRHHIMAVRRGAFANRGDLYTELAVFMKCVKRDQSAVTVTVHYLQDGNATVRFGVKKQEFMIPVGLVLKALYPLTDREIYERVLRGDHENTYLSARVELILREAKKFSLYSRDEALAYLGKHFRFAMPYVYDNMSNVEVGSKLLDEFLFVHIPKGEKGRTQKVELLCLMLRKLYAFAKGDVPEDNADSVMNHELLLPGHLYLMIMKEKLQESLVAMRANILKETQNKKKAVVMDQVFLRKMWDRTPNIGNAMTYFLNTGNLRSSSGLDLLQIAGYTIVAEKLNYYRYFSHFRSVHRGQFFTEMKTTAVRDDYLQQEVKLARFLASLGMIPTSGYADGALVVPYSYLPVMMNGKVFGGAPAEVCKRIAEVLRKIKSAKSSEEREANGIVPNLEVCLILPTRGGPFPGLYLSADAARMSRPVKQMDTKRIEYIGPMEQVFMDIACTKDDIRPATTHMEIKPTNMLSLVASLTPFSDYNQSPRNMYQCQMAKQTMGTPAHSIVHRSDNKMYRIQSPQIPIVQNERLREYQLDEYPLGTNAVVAVISYTGFDMEDAMILNKSSYERGFAHASVYKQLTVDISSGGKQGSSTSKKYFSNIKTDGSGEYCSTKLDRDGFPHIGQVVNHGDPIASWIDETTGLPSFQKHKETEPAIIEQVNMIGNSSQASEFTKASIKLRFCRNPTIGDKFSSRHGQKGVMSILWPQADMPFSESGISPDIIINPHAFPSRMTIGMLIESMAAKTGALKGKYMDATPFKFSEKDRVIDYFGSQLKEHGYNYMGSEPLYSGISGTIMQADIYIGVVYYQRLRHMVSDKSQVRATGPMNSLTRQPVKGRKKGGGIRLGEMERDSLLAHGCAFLLQDRLLNCSDKHIATVCTNCGSLLSNATQRSTVETAGQGEIAVAMKSKTQCRGHPYQGMSITVSSASSSPSSSARSSPLSTSSPSNTRRQQYHTSPAAGGYLQRTAISNAYNSGGSRSEDAETASTTSDGYHGERPSSPAHKLSALGNSGNADGESSTPGAYGSHVFSFDHVYDQQCTQSTVYENTAKAVVESSLEGYNATIFAYGQTGTGKTYTMEGFNSGSGSVEERGIIPRAIEQIFCHIQANVSARCRFLVRASYLQIYNESISDLLKPERSNLTIREDRRRGVFVEGLSEWVVRSPEEIYGLMERGGAMRATGSTKMNELSSQEFMALVNAYQARHGNAPANGKVPNGANGNAAALHPKLEAMVRQSFKVGKLNLVDLAGSERVRLSGATGQRLEESKKINQSLSALGNVISALTDSRGRQHIPYRDSKLTRILEDSLGGNCKTTMMAMVSPALEAMTESLSTLKFANRAKHIKNEARVNEDLDQKSLLRKYERELKRLRAELEERSRNVVDKRRLLELDEQRRRAEEDKMAAIRALEERSREFMLEKEEKKRLEQRISALTSQMMMSNQRRLTPSGLSGADGEKLNVEDPLIRDAIKEHQDRIRQEYECRLADLEKERETIEEEKAQVDRYKQLLLKQRDIMIALTQRLNERDEQITALQDELDAYDRHQKELEEKLDEKTAHLIHLQRVAMEHNASSPGKTDAELLKALGDWGGGATQAKMTPMSANSAVSEPPAELLITHKQFRPHPVDPVIINDNNYSNNNIGNSGNGLLSAEEKIQELRALVDAQTAEHQRMAKELEDIKSEKVSVEFQMREKLLANLQRQLEKLMLENQQLQTRAASDDQTQLQARCETLVKERRAVQTIMEHKIKALVTAIGEASDATLQTAGGAEKLGEPAKWLAREINALQRLVNASIVALRNADAGNSGKPTKESSSSQPTPTTVPAASAAIEKNLTPLGRWLRLYWCPAC